MPLRLLADITPNKGNINRLQRTVSLSMIFKGIPHSKDLRDLGGAATAKIAAPLGIPELQVNLRKVAMLVLNRPIVPSGFRIPICTDKTICSSRLCFCPFSGIPVMTIFPEVLS